MTSLTAVKVIALVAVFIISLAASVVPWPMGRHLRKAELWLSLANAFSGGIVLGAGLLHMLPDTLEFFEQYDYPWALFITSISFLLLFSVEQIFAGAHNHGGHSHSQRPPQSSTSLNGGEDVSIKTPTDSTASFMSEDAVLLPEPAEAESKNTEHSEARKAVLSAYTLLMALSVHSLFEGLGVGASDNKKELVSTMAALFSHKALEAFALGLGFYRFVQETDHHEDLSEQQIARERRKRTIHSLVILFLYSLITPLGIGIGMIVNLESHMTLLSGIMAALATGSFIFVAMIEMLPAEFNGSWTKTKLLLVFLGWGVMAGLAVVV